jgi:hypothetical protein
MRDGISFCTLGLLYGIDGKISLELKGDGMLEEEMRKYAWQDVWGHRKGHREGTTL